MPSNDKKKNSFISIETAIALLFPIGGCLFMLNDSDPNVLYEGTTWELVGQDRCIQGASTTHAVNTTIEAGLPNLTGIVGEGVRDNAGIYNVTDGTSLVEMYGSEIHSYNNSGTWSKRIRFDASKVSSLYGNANTVQPPALCMNIWKRVA